MERFQGSLAKQFHWSIEEVTLTFTISIFVLGVAGFLRRPLAEQERDLASSRSRADFSTAWVSSWQASPPTSSGGST